MKLHKKLTIKNVASVLTVFSVIAATTLAPIAHAAQLTNRSLTIGSSQPSAVTTHQFQFTVPTTGNVGSIRFQYCTTASGACTTPTGLATTAATLTAQSPTGFTINNTTNGSPYITRTAASVASGTNANFTFSNVTNPSTTNSTFYVRMVTYTGTDGATGAVDTGVVASSTANQITINANVDETLTFCTGTSGITTTSCAGATGTVVNLGSLSSSAAATGTSQIGASTNAQSGYSVTVAGNTLTSGANTIDPLTTAAASSPGTEQFGLSLAATGAGTGTFGTGYGGGTYRFNTTAGNNVVASAAGATGHNLYTVTNLANIAPNTEGGAYTTTLTYVATAQF